MRRASHPLIVITKKVAVLALLCVAAQTAAGGLPPDTILFEAPLGNITFTHRNHFAGYVRGCRTCHGDKPIERVLPHVHEREGAHTLCIGCHEDVKKGPRQCSHCHDRKTRIFEP